MFAGIDSPVATLYAFDCWTTVPSRPRWLWTCNMHNLHVASIEHTTIFEIEAGFACCFDGAPQNKPRSRPEQCRRTRNLHSPFSEPLDAIVFVRRPPHPAKSIQGGNNRFVFRRLSIAVVSFHGNEPMVLLLPLCSLLNLLLHQENRAGLTEHLNKPKTDSCGS